MVMDAVKLLSIQFDRLREWCDLGSRDLTGELAQAVPHAAGNHILWELGHICTSRNLLITCGCAGGERLPDSWEKYFGFGSQISTSTDDYPPLERILEELGSTGLLVARYIDGMSQQTLMSPAPKLPARVFPDVASAFVHLIAHEAHHLGKISLLRRMLGLETISGMYFSK